MHLNRYGFSFLTLVYLVPLFVIDVVGNTMSTGMAAKYYFFKTGIDVLLALYAAWQLFAGNETGHISVAQKRMNDDHDQVVGFSDISALEYIYCAVLAIYAAITAYACYELNTTSTGIVSIGSLIWTYVSALVCLVATIQFWHLKSGKIVELTKKATQ